MRVTQFRSTLANTIKPSSIAQFIPRQVSGVTKVSLLLHLMVFGVIIISK